MSDINLAALLETTLNALAAGIFVVARDGRVLFSNRAADGFTRCGAALRVINGRLTPTDRSAASALTRLLTERTGGTAGHANGHQTIALPRSGGGGLVATISPLALPVPPCAATAGEPAVSIIVQDPAVCLKLPGEAFAQLYCLTAAELRVALAMVPGARPQSAAEALGISSNTVKTHLQRIFEKTETSRQADLIALMLRTTPPVMA